MAGDGLSVMVLTYPFMQSFSQVLNFPLIFIISFLTFKLQIFMYLSGCQAKEIHSEVIHMDMYHNKKWIWHNVWPNLAHIVVEDKIHVEAERNPSSWCHLLHGSHCLVKRGSISKKIRLPYPRVTKNKIKGKLNFSFHSCLLKTWTLYWVSMAGILDSLAILRSIFYYVKWVLRYPCTFFISKCQHFEEKAFCNPKWPHIQESFPSESLVRIVCLLIYIWSWV